MCNFIFHMLFERPIKKCQVFRLTWCRHVPRLRVLTNSPFKLMASVNLKTITHGHYASLVLKE